MRFSHTNIVAKDWKSLSDFYVKVFNCKIKPPIRKLSGPWLDLATGLQNAKMEGVHLILPGHGDSEPVLEIISYKCMHEREPLMACSAGLAHIGFEVDDVDQTLNKAMKNGGQSLGKIAKITVNGVCELKFVFFRDPEGNIVELQSWKKWKVQTSIWSPHCADRTTVLPKAAGPTPGPWSP
jgi:predicted enzyme related to lactoylglutathione lyase